MSRPKGFHLTEEHKRKIGNSQKGNKNHRFGKTNSDEWKAIMTDTFGGKMHRKVENYVV